MLKNARRWPVREECLLTIHTFIVSLLKANTYLLQRHFKKVHTRNLFFHLQESEDERMARLDKKYIGNNLTRFLMGTISLEIYLKDMLDALDGFTSFLPRKRLVKGLKIYVATV